MIRDLALVAEASPEAARQLTDKIKIAVEGTWQLIEQAYLTRAWSALGYRSWDEYCTREFGTSRLRLPREERQEIVASLRESGLSTRAIAAATGISQGTVNNDLASREQNYSPADGDDREPSVTESPPPAAQPGPAPVITGTDGRQYPATRSGTATGEQAGNGADGDDQPASRDEVKPRKPRADVVALMNRVMLRAEEGAEAARQIEPRHLAGRSDEAARWARGLRQSLEPLQRLADLLERA